MNSTTYTESVNGALHRLQTTGFYLDNGFANHGPIAAEPLARLGYCQGVDCWVDASIHDRSISRYPCIDLIGLYSLLWSMRGDALAPCRLRRSLVHAGGAECQNR